MTTPPAAPGRHQAGRHRAPSTSSRISPSGRRWLLAGSRAAVGLAAALVIAATGMGWAGYHSVLAAGITVSNALVGGAGGPASTDGEENILIMGLDSRLDQHGQPLPQDIYDALHAGDESVGGYNANVLILVHIPKGNGPITAVSIPRDDYVELAGCPTWNCKGKIKQAYGMAYQKAKEQLTSHSTRKTTEAAMSAVSDDSTAAEDQSVHEQTQREAGRAAEIATVRRLLGVPIDHFIEITLGAFFQIARVVEPISVCVNDDTSDSFSGAKFHKGPQEIDAAQAMAFVRQRRDENDILFTDMDRTRRQQAFIASLVSALRRGGALSSPNMMHKLLDVARQNVAVDNGFDLAGFLERATKLADSPLSLYTLPIAEFGKTEEGEDINKVDVPTIRSIVTNLFNDDPATSTTSLSSSPRSTAPAVPAVLDVLNASTHEGLANSLVRTFANRGFTAGSATTADALADTSTIAYGPGAADAAATLAGQLDLVAHASDAVAPGTIQLTIGADFPVAAYTPTYTPSDAGSATTTRTATPVTTVAATATGTHAPEPTELSKMTANANVCVK
jgi:LCP family protein required for cell wall assembly